MSQMVLGAFNDQETADQAIRELEKVGYDREHISVISKSDKYKSEGYGTSGGMAESAVAGATTGAAVGGLAGLLAGTGILPALAGFFIGGPIGAALGLTGAAAVTLSGAATGAMAGGLIGALSSLGLNKETAESYERTVNEGGVVVGITEEGISTHGKSILQQYGATDVSQLSLDNEEDEEATSESYMPGRQQPVFGETIVDNGDDLTHKRF